MRQGQKRKETQTDLTTSKSTKWTVLFKDEKFSMVPDERKNYILALFSPNIIRILYI